MLNLCVSTESSVHPVPISLSLLPFFLKQRSRNWRELSGVTAGVRVSHLALSSLPQSEEQVGRSEEIFRSDIDE